jgi:predicted RNA-binding Zn ribbon-like protein
VIRQRAKGNTRTSTNEPAAKAVKVSTSTGEIERKRKAEDGTTEQVTQLKELVHRLLKSQKGQETVRDTQQEKLLVAIIAQAKTIAKLEATIQGKTKELGEIRT